MSTPITSLFIQPGTLNVGIGTSQPRAKLEVAGAIIPSSNEVYDLGSASLRWRDLYLSGNSINLGGTTITRDSTTGGIKFIDPATNQPLDSTVRNLTASNLTVLGDYVTLNTITSNTEQMVITNAGTGPALKVTQTGANSIAEFYDDGNALAMTIADGGNVGIGTANPQATLVVYGNGQASLATFNTSTLGGTLRVCDSSSATNNGGAVVFGTFQGNFAAIKSSIIDGTTNTIGHLSFHTRNTTSDSTLTNRMTILNNGYVGIGTATPQAGLHVDSQIKGTDGPSASFITSTCLPNSYNYVLNGGNDTGSKLVAFINGSTRVGDNGPNALTIRNDGGPLYLGQSAFSTVFLGNVGIGTTQPLAKLHVNGVIRNIIYEFRGKRSGPGQSGVHDTEVPVQFDRSYDPYSLWNAATQGTYYTVPITGTYCVNTNFLVYPYATFSYIYTYAKVTNSSDVALYDAGRALTSLNVYTQLGFSTILNASVNDRIRIIGKQVSTVGANYQFIHADWGDVSIFLLAAS